MQIFLPSLSPIDSECYSNSAGTRKFFDRLIFGTDYPLCAFHLNLWEFLDVPTIRQTMKTTNRFDRQYLAGNGLGLRFSSLNVTGDQFAVPRPFPFR